jgi:hypothetical protein
MLELNTLDVLAGSEEGRWCYPRHPRTGVEIMDAQGQRWGFKLVGRHAAVARDAVRRMNDERAAIEGQGRLIGEAEAQRMNAEFLAACTKAWTPMKLDGADFVFTHENAVKFFGDSRFRWVEGQLRAFIMDDGHFFPDSPSKSATGPSGASS